MVPLPLPELAAKADRIRREVVEIATANGAGHIAPSLSCVDVVAALYYAVMERGTGPADPERDRVVFSKGHGAYGLYAILADLGWIPRSEWTGFYRGSPLKGCVEYDPARGLDAGTGSLGHGLPLAAGLAFGARHRGRPWRTWCIVGDGEMQEGSCWEALQFAVRHELGNLVVVVDKNNLQAMDRLDRVLTPAGRSDDLRRKCEGFGCAVVDCPGHDLARLVDCLGAARRRPDRDRPLVVLAETVKGWGVPAIENKACFHFRLPTPAELAQGVRYA